jgi:hypothetical protein
MNDEELIWEAYQSSNSNTVYHVSRRKFDDIHPWSHFTKNFNAAKDIVETDKSEGKYNSSFVYYSYKYEMNSNLRFMRMRDIHSPDTPQWGGNNTWEHSAVMNFIGTEDQNIQEYIKSSILRLVREHTDDKNLFDYVLNLLSSNRDLIRPNINDTENDEKWEDVISKIMGDVYGLRVSSENFEIYKRITSIIGTLQDVLIDHKRQYDHLKKWNIWVFNDKYEDSVDKFLFRKSLLENYYDGIVYKNEIEGGGDSYIIFDPKKDLKLVSREVIEQNP